MVALALKDTFEQGFRTMEEAEKARRRFIARHHPRGDVSFSTDFQTLVWSFYCFNAAEGPQNELPTVGMELFNGCVAKPYTYRARSFRERDVLGGEPLYPIMSGRRG